MPIYTDSVLAGLMRSWVIKGNVKAHTRIKSAAYNVGKQVLAHLGLDEDAYQSGLLAAVEAADSWAPAQSTFEHHVGPRAIAAAMQSVYEDTQEDETAAIDYDQQEDTSGNSEQKAAHDDLYAAVGRLVPEDAWLMKAYFGLEPMAAMNVNEIAASLNVSVSTVSRELNKVLLKLKVELTK